jgi:hypothetical protein
MAGGREVDAKGGANHAQKSIGHLDEDAGAITGIRFTADGTTMIKVGKYGYCLLNDLMGLLSLDVGHKANAAGIMLEPGIIKTLLVG